MTEKLPFGLLMQAQSNMSPNDCLDGDVIAVATLYKMVKNDLKELSIPQQVEVLDEYLIKSVKFILGYDLANMSLCGSGLAPFANVDRERVGRIFMRLAINNIRAAYQRFSFFNWTRNSVVSPSMKNGYLHLSSLLVCHCKGEGEAQFIQSTEYDSDKHQILYYGILSGVDTQPERFRVQIGDNSTWIEVSGYDEEGNPNAYVIKNPIDVLGKDGEWHDNRLPSNRDDDYLEVTRFSSSQEAKDFINALVCQGKIELFIDRGFRDFGKNLMDK